MNSNVTPEKLTETYLKIKIKRAELSAEFKDKDSAGMFYRSVKTRYWTSDWESMYKFVMENNVPEFFDKRLNQGNVRQFLEENPDLVPRGLNVDSEYAVAVRKK